MPMSTIDVKVAELGGLHPCVDTSGQDKVWPLTEQEIADLEGEFGVTLPTDYRQFLAQYGACRFKAIVRSRGASYYRVARFYGGGVDEDDAGHIRGALLDFEDRMPSSILPIAECDDGAICIGTRNEVYGKVFYWDRENEWDWQQQERISAGETLSRDEQFQNVSQLADSFEAFICDLEVIHSAD